MLIAHGFNPLRWAKRWGLKPFTYPCFKCGDAATTTIPFACNDLRGLIAPTCRCGHDRPPYCVVRTEGDLLEGLT